MIGGRVPRVRVGLVVVREGNLLLVCHRKGERRSWMLPGGGLQWGETLAECGVREVREETGLCIDPGRLLFLVETIDPGGSRHVINMVMHGTYVSGTIRRPTEDIIETVEWCPIADLESLAMHPPIVHELTVGLMEGFADHAINLGARWSD